MARNRTEHRTPKKGERKWRDAFLRELASRGSVTRATKKAKISRSVVYDEKAKNEAFAKAWAEAEEIAIEAMEEEARRRAVEGTIKPIFQQGEQVGHVREYSDTLLIFLLKAHRPDKYRDRIQTQHQFLDEDGKPMRYVVPVPPTPTSVEQWQAMTQPTVPPGNNNAE